MKKVFNKFPILSCVVLVILTMFIPFGAVYPLVHQLPYYFGHSIKYGLTFILTLVITLLVYKRIPFTLKNPSFIKGLFSFGLLGLICALMAIVFSYSTVDKSLNIVEFISYILYVLMIALSEELLFRGLILNIMLDAYGNDKKNVIKAILFASIIFGLRHLLNFVTMPDRVITIIGQVFFTFMAGFYLSSLYIRTKNIYIGTLIHFIEDFSSMFWPLVSIQAAQMMNSDGQLLLTLGLVAIYSVYVVFGMLFLNDKKFSDYSIKGEIKYE